MKSRNRKLSLRMKGEDVQRLQVVLGHLGFSIADREGYFGKTTRQAVLTFQEQHDLESTGIIDEESAELINRIPQGLRDSADAMLERLEQLKLKHGFLVRREVVGRLLNEETGKALSGFRVRGYHLPAGGEPKDLGYDITNKRGLCSFVVLTRPETVVEESNQPVDRLQLRFLNAQGEVVHRAEFELKPGQTDVLDVLVPAQALPQPPLHPLEKLAIDLNLSLPRNLLPFLAEHKIYTLEDIRRAGGLRRLENLPTAADHPAIKALEAHANLSVLSDDPSTNDALINRGYDSLAKIAGMPRKDFVRALGGPLGDRKAAQLHATARAQHRLLNAFLTGIGDDIANRQVPMMLYREDSESSR